MALNPCVVFFYGVDPAFAQRVISTEGYFGQVDPFGLGSWHLFIPALIYADPNAVPVPVSLAYIDPLMRFYRTNPTVTPPPHEVSGRFEIEPGSAMIWVWSPLQSAVTFYLES